MTAHAAILIVEDSLEDYEACVAALTGEGQIDQKVVHCESGEEALAYLQESRNASRAGGALPAMVLLDLNLPGLDGHDVLASIKGNADTRHMPVVVMTSSSDENDITRSYRAGANSYVVKPVTLDGFMAAVARLKDYWFKTAALPPHA